MPNVWNQGWEVCYFLILLSKTGQEKNMDEKGTSKIDRIENARTLTCENRAANLNLEPCCSSWFLSFPICSTVVNWKYMHQIAPIRLGDFSVT